MSNHLAVATVTAALQRMLRAPVAADVPGAVVTIERPDVAAKATTPTVNLYLYQVLPCGARRNEDLPHRRVDGSLVERPRAALELGYLVSFFGDESELEPQRLLGSAVRTLTTRPLLGTELFDEVVAAAGANPPVHAALLGSDLGEVAEPVRLSPQPLDLDSLSKLWSVFFQMPHALSVAWSASAVFVEETLATGRSLPVTTPSISVAPMRRPTITAIAVAGDPVALLTSDALVRVSGHQLAGESTVVRIAGFDVQPSAVSDHAVDVDLADAPTGAIRAGTAVVQVVHRRALGVPPTLRDDVTSRPFAVAIHPRVTGATVSNGELRLDCAPAIGPRQRGVVELRDPGAPTPEHLLAVGAHTGDVTSITITLAGVATGTYDAVLVVDGAAGAPVAVVVP